MGLTTVIKPEFERKFGDLTFFKETDANEMLEAINSFPF